MDLPLISHPTRGESPETYPESHLTQLGDLRLDAHNRVVADRAIRLFGQSESSGKSSIEAAAALHDFGKATPQFQSYIRDPEKESNEETAHARLGALATWYVLGELDASDRDRLAGTLAVARHHQAIPNAAQYTAETLADAFERNDGVIRAQVDAIDDEWPEAAEGLLAQAGIEEPDWTTFYEFVRSGAIGDQLRALSADTVFESLDIQPSYLPERLYDRTLRYWSAITLADKSHAMDIPETKVFDLDTLDRNTIEHYIEDVRSKPAENDLEGRLNDDRERARRQAIRGVHEWLDDGPAIATLTLPTGLGKTFTGLSAAFETRDLLAERESRDKGRPVIYALPYTSIIEQTREIFEDPDLWGADPEQSALTVHHYLSQTLVQHDQFDLSDTTETDEDTATFLGEAWRDGTILTTFVQLFESLTGPTNRQGLKLPALRDSVVILDEPQALPKDWWDGIERLLDLLVEEYNTSIIAMTATQPTLVRGLETESLLEAGQHHDRARCPRCRSGQDYETTLEPADKGSYYETAQRVRYCIDETALSKQVGVDESHIGYDDAADRIVDATGAAGSTLAVCNTISSSRELTEVLASRPGFVHLGEFIEDILTERNVGAVDASSGDASESVENIVEAVIDRFMKETMAVRSSDRTALLTLNSRYRPFDREILIEIADRLSTGEIPFVLVSTQAIEAGVDLSFQRVFRDLAPLDSIVQAAGRCNRSYEWGEEGGRVEVWLLADPDEDTPESPSHNPPAHYVYERKSETDRIPGHLPLISSVLAEIPNHESASDVTVSRDAVTRYFDALGESSLWTTDLREAIDDAQGRWLSRQSLIGGYETVDVVVGVTDSDAQEVTQLSEQLAVGDPAGYDRLEAAASLRVSVPESVIEEAPMLNRLDKQQRGSDGVHVFEFLGSGGLEYDLTKGGLFQPDSSVGDRFTT